MLIPFSDIFRMVLTLACWGPYQHDMRWFEQIRDRVVHEGYVVPVGTRVYCWPDDRIASFVSHADRPRWGEVVPPGLWLVPPQTVLIDLGREPIVTSRWSVVRTNACVPTVAR